MCGDCLSGHVSGSRSSLASHSTANTRSENTTQLDEVFAATPSADVILLDNFSLEDLVTAVNTNKGRATLEASGNVTVETIRAIAETGVDVISSGWITHSAPSLDLGLDFD